MSTRLRRMRSSLLMVAASLMMSACPSPHTTGPTGLVMREPAVARQAESTAEAQSIQRWYSQARKAVVDLMKSVCRPAGTKGWRRAWPTLSSKSQIVKRRGGNREVVTFHLKLTQQPRPVMKPMDLFACPRQIAEALRQPRLEIQLVIWERRQLFGAVLRFADITVNANGPTENTPYKTRSPVFQTQRDLCFPRLKTARDPGLQALGKPLPFRMSQGSSFALANLTFKRTKPGRYILGTWKTELVGEVPQPRDWAKRCKVMQRQLAALGKPRPQAQPKAQPQSKTHRQLIVAAATTASVLCQTLATLHAGVHPFREEVINKAAARLVMIREQWNKVIHGGVAAFVRRHAPDLDPGKRL